MNTFNKASICLEIVLVAFFGLAGCKNSSKKSGASAPAPTATAPSQPIYNNPNPATTSTNPMVPNFTPELTCSTSTATTIYFSGSALRMMIVDQLNAVNNYTLTQAQTLKSLYYPTNTATGTQKGYVYLMSAVSKRINLATVEAISSQKAGLQDSKSLWTTASCK